MPTGLIGEDNGRPLCVQDAEGIVEDGLQQRIERGDMAKVLSGAQQRRDMLAVMATGVATGDDLFQRLLPGSLRTSLDLEEAPRRLDPRVVFGPSVLRW